MRHWLSGRKLPPWVAQAGRLKRFCAPPRPPRDPGARSLPRLLQSLQLEVAAGLAGLEVFLFANRRGDPCSRLRARCRSACFRLRMAKAEPQETPGSPFSLPPPPLRMQSMHLELAEVVFIISPSTSAASGGDLRQHSMQQPPQKHKQSGGEFSGPVSQELGDVILRTFLSLDDSPVAPMSGRPLGEGRLLPGGEGFSFSGNIIIYY